MTGENFFLGMGVGACVVLFGLLIYGVLSLISTFTRLCRFKDEFPKYINDRIEDVNTRYRWNVERINDLQKSFDQIDSAVQKTASIKRANPRSRK